MRIFLFKRDRDHLNLHVLTHSFPKRRSSDLAGVAGHQPVAVYATNDGEHAVVGTLINAQGEDIGAEALQRLVAGPMSARTWAQLEASEWIADGKADAPRVIYTFSDPNCPFCNKFWGAARPGVDWGEEMGRASCTGRGCQDV